MKVAIYARVSTEKQDADTQISMCKEYCGRNRYEVAGIYKDAAVSGARDKRPALDAMLADMKLRKFDTVMVTKLDRLGRSLQHLLELFDTFHANNVSFISTTQSIDTSSAAGKAMMRLLGIFAEFERDIIIERTKDELSKIKAELESQGYHITKEGKRITHLSNKALPTYEHFAIRQEYGSRAKPRVSMRALATRHGVSVSTIHRIVSSEEQPIRGSASYDVTAV